MTEIKITRRVALDKPYEYYELEATYDPEGTTTKGNRVIKDMEKQVAFIRKTTATEETKQPQKAPKIPTKKGAVLNTGILMAGTTEDIKIADLKEGDKVNISVRLLKVGEAKAFISKTDGSPGMFRKCDVEDDSGQMKLTLFGDQVALVQDIKPNAWLTIENGYVKAYQGVLELSVGQYGTMKVVYNG